VQSTYGGAQYVAGWGTTIGSQGFSVGFDSGHVDVDEYGNTLTFTTTATITDGDWHLIAVTSNGTTATAYLDGTSLGTQAFPVALDTAPAGVLQVGAGVWGYQGVDGSLDELAIFPAALSGTQIGALFTAGTAQAPRRPGVNLVPGRGRAHLPTTHPGRPA
jgi:hypothetical protein